MSDDTQARAVRRAYLGYSDSLVAAVRAEVPAETLLSWGIPWDDIEKVLFAKGRLVPPGPARSSGGDRERSAITQRFYDRRGE